MDACIWARCITLYLSLRTTLIRWNSPVNESGDPNWPRDMGVGHIAISVDGFGCDINSTRSQRHQADRGAFSAREPHRCARVFFAGSANYKIELIDGGEFRPAREALPASIGDYD